MPDEPTPPVVSPTEAGAPTVPPEEGRGRIVFTITRRVGSRAAAKAAVASGQGQQQIVLLEGQQGVDLEPPDADPRQVRPATFFLPDEEADELPIGALVRLTFEVLPRTKRQSTPGSGPIGVPAESGGPVGGRQAGGRRR